MGGQRPLGVRPQPPFSCPLGGSSFGRVGTLLHLAAIFLSSLAVMEPARPLCNSGHCCPFGRSVSAEITASVPACLAFGLIPCPPACLSVLLEFILPLKPQGETVSPRLASCPSITGNNLYLLAMLLLIGHELLTRKRVSAGPSGPVGQTDAGRAALI